MICKRCGKEIDDSLSECPYCHTPAVEVEEFTFEEGADDGFKRDGSKEESASFRDEKKEETHYCPICGTKVAADMIYCPVCGKNLRGSGFAGDGRYEGAAQKSEPNESKLYSDSRTIGILSLCLWIISPILGFILGALAIRYGRKGENSLAVKLGAIGIVISALAAAVRIMVVLNIYGSMLHSGFVGAQILGGF